MSLEDVSVVELIGVDTRSGDVVLTISDHLAVVFKHAPDAPGERFLWRASVLTSDAGITLTYEVSNQGADPSDTR